MTQSKGTALANCDNLSKCRESIWSSMRLRRLDATVVSLPFAKALAIVLACGASTASAQYTVEVHKPTQSLLFSLKLKPTNYPTNVQTRGAKWGLQSQVSDVRCDGIAIVNSSQDQWTLPARCEEVTWRVTPDQVDASGAIASDQRTLSVASGKWYLLAEPTSLLIRLDSNGASSLRVASDSIPLISGSRKGRRQTRVPTLQDPPDFFVIGAPRILRAKAGGMSLIYVADQPDIVESLALNQRHRQVLDYLLTVLPSVSLQRRRMQTLLVVWLGVSSKKGVIGGAAGQNSFLANYLSDADKESGANADSLVIVAHEQFHQLLGQLDMRSPLPLWASESLAQYYALKAVERAGFVVDQSGRSKLARSAQDTSKVGLIALNREFLSGNQDVYPIFYSKGSAFWRALDMALQRNSKGRRSLDYFLDVLLSEKFSSDGQLPESFASKIRAVLGAEAGALFDQYLGT